MMTSLRRSGKVLPDVSGTLRSGRVTAHLRSGRTGPADRPIVREIAIPVLDLHPTPV